MEGSVASPSTSVGTVPVMLTTSLESLSIPAGPYMVPLDWRRTQLSTLVNKLLSGGSAVPFDFIADGVLLRTSLTEYLASAGQTAETTLHLEYVRSVLPPTYVAAFEHDDWVASVDASHESQFLTASYDGAVRVFSASDASTPKLTFSTVRAGSANPSITDARWANSEGNAIVTAGMDGVVRFWILSESGSGATKKWNGEAHTQPVSSVDVATSASGSPSVLSAGWDGTLALWDDDGSSTLPNDVVEHSASGSEDDEDDDNDGDTKRKRQRVRAGARKAAATRDRLRRDPVMHVIHATGSHTKAQFQKRTGSAGRDANANAAWSAAWDGSLKAWDFATGGVCTATKTSDKVMLALDETASGSVITGHMDRSASIWDMRTDAVHVATHVVGAHTGPVSAVRAHPTAGHLFATASHDGTVKMWDARSHKRALFSLTRPAAAAAAAAGDKVLALDWTPDGQTIVAGGEDRRITVHKGEGIGA